MRGGNNWGILMRCARRTALAALIGILWSQGGTTLSGIASAEENQHDANCARLSRNEKSILVASSKASTANATDSDQGSAAGLEPIAIVSAACQILRIPQQEFPNRRLF